MEQNHTREKIVNIFKDGENFEITSNDFIKKSIDLKAVKDGDKEIDTIINILLKDKKNENK